MAKVRVYAKSRVDITAGIGVYAYLLDDMHTQISNAAPFKHMPIKTMAQADCAAYVNALSILSQHAVAPEVTELEIITDSGVVYDLLDTFKAQKHCEEIARWWREKVKPVFVGLKELKIVKIDRELIAGDAKSFNIHKCDTMAGGALQTQRDKFR